MKTRCCCLLFTWLAGAMLARAQAPEVVNLPETPASVQNTITAQVGAAPIQEINREVVNGVTIYSVFFLKEGKPESVQILENGAVVPSSQPAPAAPPPAPAPVKTLTLAELPVKVNQTIGQTLGETPIDTIRRETKAGGDVYLVTTKQNGDFRQIRVSDEGIILEDTSTTPIIVTLQANEPPPEKLTLEKLPAAVQTAIKAHTDGAPVEFLDRLMLKDQTVYEVRFTGSVKGYQELWIARDGKVLRHTTNDVASAIARMTARPIRIRFDQLPSQVQATLREEQADQGIRQINLKSIAGTRVYEVYFLEEGSDKTIMVAEDGSRFYLNGGTIHEAAGGPPQSDRVTFAELPEAVQITIKNEASSGAVTKIEQRFYEGSSAFVVTLNNAGVHRELLIRPDGQLVLPAPAEKSRPNPNP